MKKINREKLIITLNKLKAGLSSKEILEQSDSFIFYKGNAYSYNDEIWVNSPCDIEEDFAVKSTELLSILAKLQGEEIYVGLKNDQLLIKDGKARLGIVTDKEITLPLEEFEKKKKWYEVPDDLIEGVKLCLPACSRDMSKPALGCIHIKNNYVEACDIYNLARFKMKEEFKKELLIPSDIISELIKNDSYTKYATSEGWVHFKESNKLIFSCRTLKAKYPDLDKLLEQQKEFIGTVKFSKELTGILEKAAIFSDAEDSLVDVSLKGKKAVIRGEGKQGWFEEKTVVQHGVEKEIEMVVNPKSLIQVLRMNREVKVYEGSILAENEQLIYILII